MKKPLRLGASLALMLVTAACTTPTSYDYTAFKAARPRSILVLPPISQSLDVKASLGTLSVATRPLAEAGYYVLPVALTTETFKQNGVAVADDAHHIPVKKLHDVFGADAGLYLVVEKYGVVYQILGSTVEVQVRGRLTDLRSGLTLWEGRAQASSAETQGDSSGSLLGKLVSAAVNQVISNLSDHSVKIAKIASSRLLSAERPNGILYGPYHPKYGTD